MCNVYASFILGFSVHITPVSKRLNQINIFVSYRFLHIGPILTSFIYGQNSQSSAHADVNDTQMFDPLRILPISDSETTVILCSNALDPFYSETAVALNTIAIRYGFQVSYCNGDLFHHIQKS